MKRLLKILLGLILVIILIAGIFIIYVYFSGIPTYSVPKVTLKVEITPERVERGRTIASLACRGCHLDYETGKLTGKKLLDIPEEFGTAYSRNITQDKTYGIGTWTDAELAVLLRTGISRDGRYTPPWMISIRVKRNEI